MTRPAKQTDRSRKSRRQSAFNSLTSDQRRAWTAFMRVRLRLTYEMNRQLQADSKLSLPDYDVLIALRYAPRAQMQIRDLAAGSLGGHCPLSHQLPPRSSRGLVALPPTPSVRRRAGI